MPRLEIHEITLKFLPGDRTEISYTGQLIDDVLGVLGPKYLTVTDPTQLAGGRTAALALIPPTSSQLVGVPLAVRQ